MSYLMYSPSCDSTPALVFETPPPDSAGALGARCYVVADGLGLRAAQLAGEVGSQKWDRLLVGELTLPLRGEVFLLEAEAGPVEQGLDRALGHLQGARDLAVAHVLELAQGQDEPVLLGQALRDLPDLAASLVRLLDEHGVESLGGGRQARHELVVLFLRGAVGAQVALPPAQLVVAEVAGDGVNPAAEVERLVYPVHHPQGLHEGLLGDVLGQQGVPELAPDEAVDRGDVPAVELLEGVDVARPVSPDKLDVGRPAAALPAGWLLLYFAHECLRQATTVARWSIPSGSFRACCRSRPSSVSVTTSVTPDPHNASQPGPLLPATMST